MRSTRVSRGAGTGRVARRIGVLAALIALAGLVSACNTVRGIGQDVESAGEALQRAGDGN